MQVKEYIRSNLHLPLSIPVICREFGINKTSLQERFKDYIGLSLHAYLIRGRMEKARLLLLETDDPVKIIAIECGYRRIHSFIKAFRITYHCSPGRYRRERLMIKSDIKAGESNIA
jgi:AraC-like DNA-binding protein